MATTSTSLYRAIIDGTFTTATSGTAGEAETESEIPVVGLLYPRVEAETHYDRTGREWTRRAEMTVFRREDATEVDTDGGTVVFDTEGWFGHVGWHYFVIPAGTVVPESLQIRRAHKVTLNRTGTLLGRRHVIVPVARMAFEAYLGALDNLARNAVVRQIELAR